MVRESASSVGGPVLRKPACTKQLDNNYLHIRKAICLGLVSIKGDITLMSSNMAKPQYNSLKRK